MKNCMSKLELEILIFYSNYDGHHQHYTRSDVQTIIIDFLNQGVLDSIPNITGCTLTDKGEAWLEMILKTPMPEQQWVDPRDE